MGLQLEVLEQPEMLVVKASGDVDLNSSPQLRAAILKGIGGTVGIGVDLSAIKYMDSSGVATLVEGLKACTAKKQSFHLLCPSVSVMKVLKLARLDSLFNIKESA